MPIKAQASYYSQQSINTLRFGFKVCLIVLHKGMCINCIYNLRGVKFSHLLGIIMMLKALFGA